MNPCWGHNDGPINSTIGSFPNVTKTYSVINYLHHNKNISKWQSRESLLGRQLIFFKLHYKIGTNWMYCDANLRKGIIFNPTPKNYKKWIPAQAPAKRFERNVSVRNIEKVRFFYWHIKIRANPIQNNPCSGANW